MSEITDEEYWNAFWSKILPLPEVDLNFSNDRVIAHFIQEHVPIDYDRNKTAIEIGCAPGKWMIFINKARNYQVDGCEYNQMGAKATRMNLRRAGLKDSHVFEGNFLSVDFGDKKYDVIIALGFIEHFTCPDVVIHKMEYLLKDGGILILGVPNFNGIVNRFFAKQVDKSGVEHKLLDNHNLAVMNPTVLKNITTLTPLQIRYVGGFEPALFDISNCPWWVKAAYYYCIVKYHNRFAEWFGGAWYSSYIMAAYKK